jgi:hypothetical protein
MLPPEYSLPATWALSRAPFGDENDDPLYLAIGRALSEWEELETALSGLFAVLVESRSSAAVRAYGIVASAQGRYDLLCNAAEVFFAERDQAVYAQFREIIKVLRLVSPCRNNLAHGVVRQYANYSAEGGGFYQVSPEYNSRRTTAFTDFSAESQDPFAFSTHKYAYTSSQVNSLRDSFHLLTIEVSNFARNLYPCPDSAGSLNVLVTSLASR